LAFFKDAKSRALGVPCQGEEPLGLRDACCQVAAGYKKKKHVFTLRYGPGTAPYSMGTAQHGTERVWVQHGTGMGTAQRGAAGVSPPSALTPGSATATLPAKARSLPPPRAPPEPGPPRRDKEKRFSFFPKKK
uniref:Uncharacterized protein n=1 Tax=Anas platyrhynchos TaxID=8839 RepID=A0A8B9SIR3_ANAPL